MDVAGLHSEAWSLVEKLPTAGEYNRLRHSAGWGLHTEDAIQRCLPNSLYCVCAELAGECIGMARVVGDGGLVYYIQDVIVLPAYQGMGIGTALMQDADGLYHRKWDAEHHDWAYGSQW